MAMPRLCEAVVEDRYEDTIRFLAAGDDPNQQDSTSLTPLHHACVGNRQKLIVLLLNHGANPNVRNSFGNTPIHIAAYKGYLTAVKLLTAGGADLTVRNTLGTPLDWAHEQSKHRVVAFLSDENAIAKARRDGVNSIPIQDDQDTPGPAPSSLQPNPRQWNSTARHQVVSLEPEPERIFHASPAGLNQGQEEAYQFIQTLGLGNIWPTLHEHKWDTMSQLQWLAGGPEDKLIQLGLGDGAIRKFRDAVEETHDGVREAKRLLRDNALLDYWPVLSKAGCNTVDLFKKLAQHDDSVMLKLGFTAFAIKAFRNAVEDLNPTNKAVKAFLIENNLEQYWTKLRQEGYDDLGLIKEIREEDAEDIMKSVGMKKPHFRKMIKAAASLK